LAGTRVSEESFDPSALDGTPVHERSSGCDPQRTQFEVEGPSRALGSGDRAPRDMGRWVKGGFMGPSSAAGNAPFTSHARRARVQGG
jgi:hypothetical protein